VFINFHVSLYWWVYFHVCTFISYLFRHFVLVRTSYKIWQCETKFEKSFIWNIIGFAFSMAFNFSNINLNASNYFNIKSRFCCVCAKLKTRSLNSPLLHTSQACVCFELISLNVYLLGTTFYFNALLVADQWPLVSGQFLLEMRHSKSFWRNSTGRFTVHRYARWKIFYVLVRTTWTRSCSLGMGRSEGKMGQAIVK